VRYPGEPLEERIAYFKRASAGKPFAAYKTHSHPPDIKIRKDVKYVVGVRSYVDVAASFRPFMSQHEPAFSKMWGGFPPLSQTDAEYEHFALNDAGGGKSFMQLQVYDFVIGWWPHRKDDNVLLLHYTDRVNQPEADIDKLDAFLNTKLTAEEKKAVRAQSSFEYMKANDAAFLYLISANDVQQLKGKPSHGMSSIRKGGMISKGKDRQADHDLSPKMIEQLHVQCKEHLNAAICEWLLKGGPMPDVEL